MTIDISVSPKVSLHACMVLKKSKNSSSRPLASARIVFFSASPSPRKIDDVLSASAIITVCCLSADATISLESSSPSALKRFASFSLS